MKSSTNSPEAVITIEETLSVTPKAVPRMLGSEVFVQGYQAAGVAAGLAIGGLLSMAINALLGANGKAPLPLTTGVILTAVTTIYGWAIGLTLGQRAHLKRFLAAIRRRGTPTDLAVTYALAAGGLSTDTQRIQYLIAYDAILEVIETSAAWLIQVDVTTFNLPKRAFHGDRASERAFINELLERVTPEAEARSDKPRTT